MRVPIPNIPDKKDLISYLKANKNEIIANKKTFPIISEPVTSPLTYIDNSPIVKDNTAVTRDIDVLRVKVVANTANWIDNHMDMLTETSWDKTISERKNTIPHLHDHIHKVDAKIGEVVDILSSTFSYAELGINGQGATKSLVFITDVMKSYNEKVFNQYKAGKINQHSIGLQYMKIDLAINDEDEKEEFEVWEKNYQKVINKEKADKMGFFWVVKEIKLLENSAVLFGSNEITPTLDNDLGKFEPLLNTQQKESSIDTHNDKPFKFY